MLSIDNIGLSQASTYYSRDDYYTRTSTDADGWQGKLSGKYSSGKDFKPQDFDRALKAADPRRVGYDLTFSAPKSVSIAMALDEQKKADMLAAHNQAVQETLKEIEANEIEARVTQNGVTERIKTGKMAAAKFQHYVSREQDMQLHTHTVILNKTEYQNREYAVSNENLYKNRMLYGHLYKNRLASNLQEMGYNLRATNTGSFELEGVNQELIDKFSKRTIQKNEKLKEWGIDPDSATTVESKKAVLQTRIAKENKDLSVLTEQWRAEIGDSVKIEKNLTPPFIDQEAKQAAFDDALEKLAEEKYAFTRDELEKRVLSEGVLADMTDRKDFDKLFDKSDLINLEKIVDPETVKKYGIETKYYTTEENIVIEKNIMDNIKNSPKFKPLENAELKLNKMIADNGLTLTGEQQAAVLGIVSSDKQYVGIQGLAGVGKTYMLSAVHDLAQHNGYIVRGMSFTGKAAEGMQDAGIGSTTIHSWLNSMEKLAARNRLPATPTEEAAASAAEVEAGGKKDWNFEGLQTDKTPELWLVDEAGTVNNRLMYNLQKAATARGAKVILIGDSRQHAPIGVGDAFNKLTTSGKIDTYELNDIRRQKNDELLAAVKEAVIGDVKKSTEILAKNTKEIKTAPRRYKAIAREYTSLSVNERDNTVVLTARNNEKQALNNIIRENLIKKGKLNADGKQIEVLEGKDKLIKKQFTIGDKIIFGKNDHKLKILNGQTGKITGLKDNIMTVETNGKIANINIDSYKNFDYGYAITSYKSQGITVDRAIINMDSRNTGINTRNAYYVNISRAKYGVSVYTDSQSKLSKQINSWSEKITSDDFLIKNFVPKSATTKVNVPGLPKTGSTQPGLMPEIPIPIPGLKQAINIPFKAVNIVFKATKKIGKLGWKALETAVNSEGGENNEAGKLIAKSKYRDKNWDDLNEFEKDEKIMHSTFRI